MTWKTFLTIVSLVATTIGVVALAAPAALLESKGVAADAATCVWVRELGAAILALGVMTYLMRAESDSRALRACLIGNAIVQLGLFPIELLATTAGTLTKLSGIVPNSGLHLAPAYGFVHFARRMRRPAPSS
jgi:hypothetical protein